MYIKDDLKLIKWLRTKIDEAVSKNEEMTSFMMFCHENDVKQDSDWRLDTLMEAWRIHPSQVRLYDYNIIIHIIHKF